MAEILSGADALNALNDDGQSGGGKDWSKFNVGSKYVVKIISPNDFFAFFSYGIYSKGGGGVKSFVAKNPSKKSAKGYPINNLTPWDKAWKYHADLSKEFGDKHSQEAYKYKPELRYAVGFFDLDSGERIVIDVSKKQFATLREAILKQEKKLHKYAFEVEKGNGGSVSLTPLPDLEDDLTDEQRANFDKAPEEFKIEDFHGILFERDEEAMLEALQSVGFDVTLIGYEPKQKSDNGGDEDEVEALDNGSPIDVTDDMLPF